MNHLLLRKATSSLLLLLAIFQDCYSACAATNASSSSKKKGPIVSQRKRITSHVTRVVSSDGYDVYLDLSKQVLSLDTSDPKLAMVGALQAELSIRDCQNNYVDCPNSYVPAAVLAMKAKQFDDGLVAAVDLATESGTSKHKGRQYLLRVLCEKLGKTKIDANSIGNAESIIFASCKVGGQKVQIPAVLIRPVQQTISNFDKSELQSKPIGFYTWSKELKSLFRESRLLQSPFRGYASTQRLLSIIAADRELKQTYKDELELSALLCNPAESRNLREFIDGKPLPRRYLDLPLDSDELRKESPADRICFFPQCRSFESDLLKKIFGTKVPPADFDLVNEMVARVNSGKLNLEPGKESGWYDYQLWALEALLKLQNTAEGKRLDVSEQYKEQLKEMFKGLFALSRETQIWSASGGGAGSGGDDHPRVFIYPELSAEPLATYYYRRAAGYSFIRKVLSEYFGENDLSKMHRWREHRQSEKSLLLELKEMEELFYGAYLSSSHDLGITDAALLKLGQRIPSQAAIREFRLFVKNIKTDPDVFVDGRMMVPLYYDPQQRLTKVLVFLGWAENDLSVSFKAPPEVTKISTKGKMKPEIIFESSSYPALFPVAKEIFVDKILDRNEFRKLCDENKNEMTRVLHALEPK